MRKAILVVAVGLVSLVAYAADAPAPIPKEGSLSYVNVLSGTVEVMMLGKERGQVSYEIMGAATSPTDQGLLHNSSVRCKGGFHVVNGAWDDNTGSCIYTRPDGDQVFAIYKDAGKVGAPIKGTFTFVGGTGKMAGITGSGEFTRRSALPPPRGPCRASRATPGSTGCRSRRQRRSRNRLQSLELGGRPLVVRT